jgi:hypothetical protein
VGLDAHGVEDKHGEQGGEEQGEEEETDETLAWRASDGAHDAGQHGNGHHDCQQGRIGMAIERHGVRGLANAEG